MGRRYLSAGESESALARGKCIEAFLGGDRSSRPGTIRWLRLSKDHSRIRGEYWESIDAGDSDYLDVYSFGTRDGGDEPTVVYRFDSFKECIAELDRQFPGIATKFVNESVIQDEYSDYRKDA